MDKTQLSDEQKKTIANWVGEGCGLSEIQKRLADEMGIRVSYMDARFLLLDLGLEIKDSAGKKAWAEKVDLKAAKAKNIGEQDGGPDYEDSGPGGGGVSVEIDRIKKPGAIVSGTVRFSDGVRASWAVDQYGRVAIDAGTPGYRPSESDLSEFQREVSRKLQQHGY